MKPEKTINVNGVVCNIFRNKQKVGDREVEFCSCSINKCYKDEKGHIKYCCNYKFKDLIALQLVIRKSVDHILMGDNNGAGKTEQT